ncbi:MAG TPA: hypothetical protein PKU84_06550 [Spirochaetota bacterium]|nr:hypothetical protein [Spirochaetota bacterium]
MENLFDNVKSKINRLLQRKLHVPSPGIMIYFNQVAGFRERTFCRDLIASEKDE